MDVREKLVELQDESDICPEGITSCIGCKYHKEYTFGNPCDVRSAIADKMIAHGITVQEWISVEDRLPDLIPCNAGTAYSEAVNILTTGRKVFTAIFDGDDFIGDAEFWEAEGEEVTHWTPVLLPLPQPPKGE